LADFSGYIAADELYDGPFCILSIVDNHPSNASSTRFLTMTPATTTFGGSSGVSRPSSTLGG
jgi:hypothetical protein